MGRRQVAALLTGLLVSLVSYACSADTFIQDLIRKGEVTCEVVYGLAAAGEVADEYSALAVIKNLTPKPIDALIPCGLLLVARPGCQDRIVGRDRSVTLPPGGVLQVTLFNYCIEANEYISPGDRLTIGTLTPDEGLLKLLRAALDEGQTYRTPGAVQTAVWAALDPRSPGGGAPPPILPTAAILMPVVAWAGLILAALVVAAVYSIVKARSQPPVAPWVELPGQIERRPPPPVT